MTLVGEITVQEQSGSDLTDYAVLATITDPWFFEKVSDPTQLEILASDKSTLLSFWIETFDPANYIAKIWVKIPYIRAYGTYKAYLNVNPNRTVPLSDPKSTFIYFDQGNEVSEWDVNGTAGENDTEGLPPPSYYAESVAGDYLDRLAIDPSQIQPGILITFNVMTTGLGNFFFLCDANGAGQGYRIDSRAGYYSGFLTTTSWTSWSFVSGTFTAKANTWYKFGIIVRGTSATLLYEESENTSPTKPSNVEGTYNININGGYIGLVGDNLGTGYYTYWDNIVIRKYVDPEPDVKVQIGYVVEVEVKDVSGFDIPVIFINDGSGWIRTSNPTEIVSKVSFLLSVWTYAYVPSTKLVDVPTEKVEFTIKHVLHDVIEKFRKLSFNRSRIDGTRLIIYDDDEVTPIAEYELLDQYGKPNNISIFERRPVKKP